MLKNDPINEATADCGACKSHKSRLPQRHGDLIVAISVFFFYVRLLCAEPKQQCSCLLRFARFGARDWSENYIHLTLRIRMYSYRENNSINGSIFDGELRAICAHACCIAKSLWYSYISRNIELNATIKRKIPTISQVAIITLLYSIYCI